MEDSEIRLIEGRRIEALSRMDAKSYATLCDAMGVEPEDGDLYMNGVRLLGKDKEGQEMGELIEKQREFERTLADKIPKERYAAFISEAGKHNIDASNTYLGAAQKRSLLFKFFPEDFAPGKPRDMRFTGQRAVGIIFREVTKYAEGKAKGRGQGRIKTV